MTQRKNRRGNKNAQKQTEKAEVQQPEANLPVEEQETKAPETEATETKEVDAIEGELVEATAVVAEVEVEGGAEAEEADVPELGKVEVADLRGLGLPENPEVGTKVELEVEEDGQIATYLLELTPEGWARYPVPVAVRDVPVERVEIPESFTSVSVLSDQEVAEFELPETDDVGLVIEKTTLDAKTAYCKKTTSGWVSFMEPEKVTTSHLDELIFGGDDIEEEGVNVKVDPAEEEPEPTFHSAVERRITRLRNYIDVMHYLRPAPPKAVQVQQHGHMYNFLRFELSKKDESDLDREVKKAIFKLFSYHGYPGRTLSPALMNRNITSFSSSRLKCQEELMVLQDTVHQFATLGKTANVSWDTFALKVSPQIAEVIASNIRKYGC